MAGSGNAIFYMTFYQKAHSEHFHITSDADYETYFALFKCQYST